MSEDSETTQLRSAAAFRALFPVHAAGNWYRWSGYRNVSRASDTNGAGRRLPDRSHPRLRHLAMIHEIDLDSSDDESSGRPPDSDGLRRIGRKVAEELWRADERQLELDRLYDHIIAIEWDTLRARYLPGAMQEAAVASSSESPFSPYFELIPDAVKAEAHEYGSWKIRLQVGGDYEGRQPPRYWNQVFLHLGKYTEWALTPWPLYRAMITFREAHLRQRDYCSGRGLEDGDFVTSWDFHKLPIRRVAQILMRDLVTLSHDPPRGAVREQVEYVRETVLGICYQLFWSMIFSASGRLICAWVRTGDSRRAEIEFLRAADLGEDYGEGVPRARYMDGRVCEWKGPRRPLLDEARLEVVFEYYGGEVYRRLTPNEGFAMPVVESWTVAEAEFEGDEEDDGEDDDEDDEWEDEDEDEDDTEDDGGEDDEEGIGGEHASEEESGEQGGSSEGSTNGEEADEGDHEVQEKLSENGESEGWGSLEGGGSGSGDSGKRITEAEKTRPGASYDGDAESPASMEACPSLAAPSQDSSEPPKEPVTPSEGVPINRFLRLFIRPRTERR